MSPYEMIDAVMEDLGANGIAEYLVKNYPLFAEGLAEEIEALIFFEDKEYIKSMEGGE